MTDTTTPIDPRTYDRKRAMLGPRRPLDRKPLALFDDRYAEHVARMFRTPDYVTLKQAAGMLEVGYQTLYQRIKRGTFPIPFQRIGTIYTIKVADIEAYLADYVYRGDPDPADEVAA